MGVMQHTLPARCFAEVLDTYLACFNPTHDFGPGPFASFAG